jgi:hypothetical protein
MKRFMLLPILLVGCVKDETPSESLPVRSQSIPIEGPKQTFPPTDGPVFKVNLDEQRFIGPIVLRARLYIDGQLKATSDPLQYQEVVRYDPVLGNVWIYGGGGFEFWTGTLDGWPIKLTRGPTWFPLKQVATTTFPDGVIRVVSSWPASWMFSGPSIGNYSGYYCSYDSTKETLTADVLFEWSKERFYPGCKSAIVVISHQ